MACRVELLTEALEELTRFPRRFQRTILRKVEHIAANLPLSLRLEGVQPVRGQEILGIPGRLYELDVGSGPRVAFVLYEELELLIVYMIGTHDYAKENYLKAAQRRLGAPE